jgi:hypothetical protein
MGSLPVWGETERVPCEEDTHSADEAEGSLKPQSGLLKSRDGWWREMVKWVKEERVHRNSNLDDEEDEERIPDA